ncbi:actin-related protein 10 [Leptidea sinapis]|uniref:actin-related protein 10 n=1 Tax=Leptidea sinapis TaxID=189913 RepID=UPI0021357978|nr:actin-related protein 10 [Leptidea sinapis]
MALYEGIALIQEKQAVVLDLGTDYTKFGFTSEAAPRCIIPSQYWCPSERRHKRVHDYSSTEELYDNLVHMLHLLYFRHALVNPKERKVVVVESLLTTTQFRETLAKVLYVHYEVSGVTWWDSARLVAITLGAPIVLVVDIGAVNVEVVPVVHGLVVLHAMESEPLGTSAVHRELARLLQEEHGPELVLEPAELEDITVRACFVPSRTLAERLSGGRETVRDVMYPRAAGALRVSGEVRAAVANVLWERDHEQCSLPDLVLRALRRSPVDVRRALAASVCVVGGGASLPGLRARLSQELTHLLTQPPYKDSLNIEEMRFHVLACPGNIAAWTGGSVAGAADGGGRALSREMYLRDRRLRDWPCLLHNTPPEHPHWG